MSTITLTPVDPEIPAHVGFLFGLLATREAHVNISHRRMPTYAEHVDFVRSRPYAAWYLITNGENWCGTVYLTREQELGLHLLPAYQRAGHGKAAIKTLMECHPLPRYLANIAPSNAASQAFFEGLGFKLVQHTYELSDD